MPVLNYCNRPHPHFVNNFRYTSERQAKCVLKVLEAEIREVSQCDILRQRHVFIIEQGFYKPAISLSDFHELSLYRFENTIPRVLLLLFVTPYIKLTVINIPTYIYISDFSKPYLRAITVPYCWLIQHFVM
jgi:hypothetical protein